MFVTAHAHLMTTLPVEGGIDPDCAICLLQKRFGWGGPSFWFGILNVWFACVFLWEVVVGG